jgi:hypothetical protein
MISPPVARDSTAYVINVSANGCHSGPAYVRRSAYSFRVNDAPSGGRLTLVRARRMGRRRLRRKRPRVGRLRNRHKLKIFAIEFGWCRAAHSSRAARSQAPRPVVPAAGRGLHFKDEIMYGRLTLVIDEFVGVPCITYSAAVHSTLPLKICVRESSSLAVFRKSTFVRPLIHRHSSKRR